MKLDFSEFHPLDHWPFDPRCRSFYGGGRHHLKITWDFRRREQVIGWYWKALFRCRRGKHSWIVWRCRDGNFTAACAHCSKQRPAIATEIAAFGTLLQ